VGAFNDHSATNRAGDALRPFQDRVHAGDALARALIPFATEPDVVVLGLAPGGVPLARQVADVVRATFSVFISGKIGVPGIEEVALGAVAEGSDRVVTDTMAWYIGVPPAVIERLAVRERVELARRTQLYRDGHSLPELEGKTVILVDDGLATGATIRAAARAIRSRRPRRLVAAVPVASRLGMADIRDEVDDIVAVAVRDEYASVSAAYESLAPLTDEDVLTALGRPTRRVSGIVHDISSLITDTERTIEIAIPGCRVVGDLATPTNIDYGDWSRASHDRDALAILVHAGGSSRDSYRNRYIAGRLRLEGYATLRVDLLTRDEEALDADGGSIRFDVAKIAARLTDVCDWAVRAGVYGARRAILFGAGTGAAGALMTAARRQANTLAVVVRGGRVDLAESALSRVRAPVLSIVGSEDRETLRLHADALRLVRRGKLIRVRGAGPMFGEPGALGAVAEHSVKWLGRVAANRGRAVTGSRRSAS
jgi:putative phosphoribosyl transferase